MPVATLLQLCYAPE